MAVMLMTTRGGGQGVTALADRTSRTLDRGLNAERLLEPWDTAQVCRYLGCSDCHLRALGQDPAKGFPAPLNAPRLSWWPADVLARCGLDLDEVLEVARRCDAFGVDGREVG